MPFLERQTTRITGTDHGHDGRRHSGIGKHSTGDVPHAKKPRSRPPTSIRDHLPFVARSLPPSSGPYSVGSMEIEVPVENPHTISHITRNGRHLLQLETVLFTLYYPAAFGSGAGKAPGGRKHWSRETWVPRPRVETAKGYAKFAGLPDWAGVGFAGATTMLTKLRAYRNSPPASHWPPEGNSKNRGYKVKNQQGAPPEGVQGEPVFPLLMFSHGLGGSRSAYSSLCCEFASYGFVVCAVEHRDGSGARTFVNHNQRKKAKNDWHGGARAGAADCDGEPVCEQEKEKWEALDHTDEELKQGYHKIDYIFPKDNPKDTSPNNERGVDRELRNAQIELRLCELEEAYRVLKVICAGDGEEIARQNLRGEGYVGGSSRGLEGVNWLLWQNRFHVDKMTMAGHSFGAATVVEVLRHTDRFQNVQAGIIYDIWGAPIKPPAEDPKHRIHLPLLGINSEAFMYWQSNFDAVQSLMKEASEHGSPAYLLTVRGSVHISQSDFSVLYRHITSFFLKATVHPYRAIDLNISASLEFLRLVTPSTSSGKAIIDRCMTNESILQTELLEELPDEHRPDDEWIAARLRVDHEFKKRVAAGLQRKLKRNFQGGMGTGYTTSDEVWSHFKPTEQQLENWIQQEGRGEARIDEHAAMRGDESDTASGDSSSKSNNKDGETTSLSDADQEPRCDDSKVCTASRGDGDVPREHQEASSTALDTEDQDGVVRHGPIYASAVTAGDASNDAPRNTWLGMIPSLGEGPHQN
ncbi:platelet-activating factor acetylhydrolase, isoform II-domain-containing protein [Paraphoma chrysanthemicola]|nr:platelet-activating factor acetylhydrolase, isoform II-domain-containing protein [Paraphoma chrysanthemicola]